MDTIHHLLRLNVEIEGALRVLADRDNEIAMRILDEKVRELSDIVSYLAHPEEETAVTSPLNETESSSDVKSGTSDNNFGSGNRPSIFTGVEASLISEVESPVAPSNNDSISDSVTFDDTMAESEAISRVIVMEDATVPVNETNESSLEATDNKGKDAETTVTDTITNTIKQDQPHKSPAPASAINPSADTNKTLSSTPHESQKEKIRIDEMLSRREARDLSKAFTINDRFRFQLHIFDGDKEAFNNTIQAISSFSEYDNAMTYLSGILDVNNEDQDMADFLAIIQNHFGVK